MGTDICILIEQITGIAHPYWETVAVCNLQIKSLYSMSYFFVFGFCWSLFTVLLNRSSAIVSG